MDTRDKRLYCIETFTEDGDTCSSDPMFAKLKFRLKIKLNLRNSFFYQTTNTRSVALITYISKLSKTFADKLFSISIFKTK